MAHRLSVKSSVERNALNDGATDAADEAFSAIVWGKLNEHYPGHFWRVHVDSYQGIVLIYIPILMGPTAKFKLNLDDLTPGLPQVVRAGGEIMERWNLPRSGLDVGSFLEAKSLRGLTRPKGFIPEGTSSDLGNIAESHAPKLIITGV